MVSLFSKMAVGVLVVVAGMFAQAEDHSLTSLTGTQIDLKAYDHAIAGSVKDFVIFGNMDEANFQSELTIKKEGQLVRGIFGRVEGKGIGGVLTHTTDNKSVTIEMMLAGMDKNTQTITMLVNGRKMHVQIKADKYENNHFFNPTYTATFEGDSAATAVFTLNNGQACYGFSTHLIFMIMGAYSI